MDKLKYIKLENEDGSYSDSIPLAVDSNYVDVNGSTLIEVLNDKANNSQISSLSNALDIQKTRIDNLAHLEEGSTTGDAELIDARTGELNLKGANLGDHIRNLEGILLASGSLKKISDISKINENSYIKYDSGRRQSYTPTTATVLSSTEDIEINNNLTKLYIFGMKNQTVLDYRGLAFFNASKTYISGIQYTQSTWTERYAIFDVPEEAKYVRLTINGNKTDAEDILIGVNSDLMSTVFNNYNLIDSLSKWNTVTNNATSLNEVTANGIYVFSEISFLTDEGITGWPKEHDFGLNTETNVNGNILLVFGVGKNLGEGVVQILIDPQYENTKGGVLEPHIHCRFYWKYQNSLQWGSWIMLKDNPFSTNRVLNTAEHFNNYNNDLDNFTYQGLYVLAPDSGITLSNMPDNDRHGSLLVIRPGAEKQYVNNTFVGAIQLYVGHQGNVFVRLAWAGGGSQTRWLNWISLTSSETDDKNFYSKELYKVFKTVGCIGDSLASGEVYYKKQDGTYGGLDLYDYSWGQYMAKMSGNTYYNFSSGGLTTRSWLTASRGASLAFDGNHKCTCYLIGLGQNDKAKLGSNYLGTIEDINDDDYTQNADTYYGNYGKIISMCKNEMPKCKIFLFTDPLYTDSEEFNTAIKNIANHFDGVYLIDLSKEEYDLYHTGFLGQQKRSGHYNAIGYKYMANMIADKISKYIYNHYSEFKEVEFIDTDYYYDD